MAKWIELATRPPEPEPDPPPPRRVGVAVAAGVVGVIAGGLVGAAIHAAIPELGVAVELRGVPEGDEWIATLGGAELRGTAGLATFAPVAGVVRVRGGIDDDADGVPDRCTWSAEATLPATVEVTRPACPTRDTGYTMVPIPAGTAEIGTGKEEIPERLKLRYASRETFADEQTAAGTRHRVDVAALRIGRVEVPQALWVAVMGEVPSGEGRDGETAWWREKVTLNFDGTDRDIPFVGADLPMQNVSFVEVVRFCNGLSLIEGLAPAYAIEVESRRNARDTRSEADRTVVTRIAGSDGYRLPSEVEWEYAARAGTPGQWGAASAIGDVCTFANVSNPEHLAIEGWEAFPCDDGFVGPAPVGSRAANACGLHDMLGNVWEWTDTLYADRLGSGPAEGERRRVNRGEPRLGRPRHQRRQARLPPLEVDP